MGNTARTADPVLELRRGDGAPTRKTLAVGARVEPFSVGRNGAWAIDASGVAEVHGYLFWDGRALHAQSADAGDPMRANGQPIPTTWTPLTSPSTIAFGEARIGFGESTAPVSTPRPAAGMPRTSTPPMRPPVRSVRPPPPSRTPPPPQVTAASEDDENERTHFYQPRVDLPAVEDERTRALPSALGKASPAALELEDDYESTRALMPPPQASGRDLEWPSGGAASPARDSDRTKIVPLPAARPIHAAPAPAPPTAPANVPVPTAIARPPVTIPPTQAIVVAPLVAPPIAQPQAPKSAAPDSPTPQSQQRADAPTKNAFVAKLKSDWAELSIPKRLILFLMPVAFVILMLASDDEPGPSRGKPKAAPSASVVAKVEDDAAKAKSHGKHRAKPVDDDDDDDAPAVVKSVDAGAADAASAPSAHVDAGEPPNPATPVEGSDAGVKSAERAAADAVISGDLKGALKIYKQLAKDNPDDDSYAETVRVLKAKIAAAAGKKKKARDD